MKDSASAWDRTSASRCREIIPRFRRVEVQCRNQITAAQTLVEGDGITPSPALTNILDVEFSDGDGLQRNRRNAGRQRGRTKTMATVSSSRSTSRSTKNESLTGRYAFARSQQVFPLGGLGFGAGSRLPQFAQSSPTRVQLVSFSLLSTLSATKINEVRFGYSRYRTSFNALDASVDPASFGTATVPFNMGTGKTGLPEIDFWWDVRKRGGERIQYSARTHQPEFPDTRQLHMAERTPHDEVWRRVSAGLNRAASMTTWNADYFRLDSTRAAWRCAPGIRRIRSNAAMRAR